MSVTTLPLGPPVMLSATPIVLANDGLDHTFNSTQLTNPFRVPIVINEIRINLWRALLPAAAPPLPIVSAAYSGMVLVNLKLGMHEITRGFVPMALIGVPRQSVGMIPNYPEGRMAMDLATTADITDMHTWTLPQPLIVPPGQAIVPTIRYDTTLYGVGGGLAATASISYVGRALPAGTKIPSKTAVPYIAAYTHPFFRAPNNRTYSETGAADLVNTFGRTLHIQRLTGRIFNAALGAGNIGAIGLVTEDQFTGDDTVIDGVGAVLRQPRIQISDSQGYSVVPVPTPFYRVFDNARRAWTAHHELQPHQYLLAQLSDIPTNYLPMIAMTGWREEVLS